MKYKKYFLLLIPVVLFSFILSSCKSNAPVENPPQAPGTQPVGPALSAPGNEATVNTFAIAFSWQSYESAASYRLMISQDANFVTGPLVDTSGLTSTNYTGHQGSFHTGIYYYWRVLAVTPSGNSPWSTVWRYRIVLPPPPAPVLTAPPNGAMSQPYTPLFQWNAAPSADYYRFQVSQGANFTQVLFDSNRIAQPQMLMPPFYLDRNTLYFWRVNASNSQGISTGPWSSVWNFTTLNGPIPNSVKGTITFADTNFLFEAGLYYAAAFSIWPPSGDMVSKDSLVITKVGNVYQASYNIRRLYNGSYVIAVNFTNLSTPNITILGIYGCDTNHVAFSSCPLNPVRVTISNNFGVDSINFLSWADTTYRIF